MPTKSALPFILSGAVGAVAIVIIGFSAGWVVTSGSAHASATAMSGQAVRNQLVPICVHQFNEQANRTNRLEALRKLAEWKREKFVDDGGWATMPGGDSSVSGVARLCAANLIKA